MEVTNVIVRKPISEEQRMIGIGMFLQLYPKVRRINDLSTKLAKEPVSYADLADGYSIAAYANRCAIELGFGNLNDLLHFVGIYGVDAL